MLNKLNKFSSHITQKMEHAPIQAMLYSLGLTKKDMNKPQIGISSIGNTSKLNLYSSHISRSLINKELIPMPFKTIGVSDAISMGTFGMRYSLPSRELIADSIETVVAAHHYDGIICIPGCDENLPGSLMGIARLNRPGLIVYGSSMRVPSYKEESLDTVSTLETYEKYETAKIIDKEHANYLEKVSYSGLNTANTMAICFEIMGMMLPNSSSSLSGTEEKIKECKDIGNIIKNLLIKDIKPSDILTKQAFQNAIVAMYTFGGSTNAVIHLLACAKSAGVLLNLDDF